MQRIGAPSLISFTGSIFRVFVGALVAGLLLPTIGIVFGGGIIAVVVNALIGACGIFFQLLTTALGISGAVVALLVGQLIGWYLDQGAGVIAATLGAMVLLLIWPRLVAAKVILYNTSLSVLRRPF
jgi:uncharacterized membrane protein YeaQ/YmgE (transglycosylase-associated protein family)